jgi:hypothetical protein
MANQKTGQHLTHWRGSILDRYVATASIKLANVMQLMGEWMEVNLMHRHWQSFGMSKYSLNMNEMIATLAL